MSLQCWVSSRLTPDFWEWPLVDMRRLRDPLRWLERGKFFGGCAAVERQGEAVVVVAALPASESVSGRFEVLEAVPPPELLVVDPMAPLDFAVLLRAPGPNVSVSIPAASTPSTKASENSWPWSLCTRLMGNGKARRSSARNEADDGPARMVPYGVQGRPYATGQSFGLH